MYTVHRDYSFISGGSHLRCQKRNPAFSVSGHSCPVSVYFNCKYYYKPKSDGKYRQNFLSCTSWHIRFIAQRYIRYDIKFSKRISYGRKNNFRTVSDEKTLLFGICAPYDFLQQLQSVLRRQLHRIFLFMR